MLDIVKGEIFEAVRADNGIFAIKKKETHPLSLMSETRKPYYLITRAKASKVSLNVGGCLSEQQVKQMKSTASEFYPKSSEIICFKVCSEPFTIHDCPATEIVIMRNLDELDFDIYIFDPWLVASLLQEFFFG